MLTLVAYFSSFVAPQVAAAQAEEREVHVAPASSDSTSATREVAAPTTEGEGEVEPPIDDRDAPKNPEVEQTDPERPQTVQALPNGPAKSAVTPQAISLPNAEGSIEGMGESFTPNLSAGTGTFTVPIAVAPGRAGVQPSLALSYSTSGGNGPVGVGWSLAVPFIARQTDRGLPRYVDGPAWHPQEDRFIYNGSQELVPVRVEDAIALDGSSIPAELVGWQLYRARVESAFMRFFRSPDGLQWVVQDKNGTRFDFGVLPAGDGPGEMISASVNSLTSELEDGAGRIFAWGLTRMADAHGSAVYYRYLVDQGLPYISDIHYVSPTHVSPPPENPNSPVGGGCNSYDPAVLRSCPSALWRYARRIKFLYETRDDVYESYTTTWRTATGLRLKRVEVTSYDSELDARSLVRRYHLRYDPTSFISLLAEVQVEGRPDVLQTFDYYKGVRTVPEDSLTDTIIGRTLPPMRFRYSQAPNIGTNVIPGFGGLDATVHMSPASPPVSVSDDRADLFDVNSDGLPDVIVTDPARNRTKEGEPAVGVYFNGFAGPQARPAVAGGFSEAIPMAIPPGQSSVLNLGNLNINPMDMDGDGRSDILHMPRLANYGYFSPSRASDAEAGYSASPAEQSWEWVKREVVLPEGDLDPRVDFGRDGARIKVVDVNNDHLIDVVRTTGTEMQTFLNLGWLEGGDGRFGSAVHDGEDWQLSTTPISSCVLHRGFPVDFGDPQIRLADMNGDGLQDIVKVRQGQVVYWPGRGPGLWGAGDPSCESGTATGRDVEMLEPPQQINVELENVFFSDVNMDGASDVVQVRFDAIDVWLNIAGAAFTDRIIIDGAPAEPGFANRIRFADIDGSGTTDVVYGDANNWRYIDPMGGQRPRLLVGVENGLGGITTLEYESSANDYLRDLREAEQCADSCCERFLWSRVDDSCDSKFLEPPTNVCARISSGSPVVSNVVRAVQTSDQFASLGVGLPQFIKRSEFHYHDAYYEGIEQEFRGFGAADSIEIGDVIQPTSITRTHFDQGRRPGSMASDRRADNPNEALKGRTYLTEAYDLDGTYLSTSHSSFTVRELLVGLDERTVSYAFVHQSDDLRYDTGPFVPDGCSAISLPVAVRQRATSGLGGVSVVGTGQSRSVQIRGAGYAHIRSSTDVVDNVGHVTRQTAHGRIRGEYGEPFTTEAIQNNTETTLCEPDAYIWRTAETGVQASGDGQVLSHTLHGYGYPTCDRIETTVNALLPPEGGFEFGGTNAETMMQASQQLKSSTTFDRWGNATRMCTGASSSESQSECLRFTTISFDTYEVNPTVERIATERPTGAHAVLQTAAAWDDGVGVLTHAVDPSGLETLMTYDGLGRMTSLTPSPPDESCRTSGKPLTRMTYALADELFTPVNRISTVTAYDCRSDGDERVAHKLVDGLGRTRVALATAEDEGDPQIASRYQRSGLTRFAVRGAVAEAFQPDLISQSADLLTSLSPPSTIIPSSLSFYDAFGRVTSAMAEDGSIARSVYHALSTDVWDPNDLDPGSSHHGTPATERQDGHGRITDQVLRNRQVGRSDIEYYRLWTDYRADGRATRITRAQTLSGAPRSLSVIATGTGSAHVVSRDLIYDTAGRRIASTDADTDSRLPTRTRANRTWRYLFNRVGDLAAVRDPRGCGQNFYYDHAGRLVAEHYVSCAEAQSGAEISIVNVPANAIGLEEGDGAVLDADAMYYFDGYPGWVSASDGFVGIAAPPESPGGLLGRATAVLDRGQRSVLAYDALGRAVWSARQLTVIAEQGVVAPTLVQLGVDRADALASTYVVSDTQHTYVRTASYDYAGRPLSTAIEPFAGTSRRVEGTLAYNARGVPHQASVEVSFADAPGARYARSIVDSIKYTRDGLVAVVQYADSDSGIAGPRSESLYDVRRRPSRMFTYRAPSRAAGALATQEDRPLDAVSVLVDQSLIWDRSSNLIELLDGRPGNEWADGFRPASYRVSHDALYRVVGVELDYTQDTGARTPADDYVDYRDELEEVREADPMQPGTASRIASAPDGRPASLTYEYDWLANMVESTDDAQQFYERSLGTISNGFEEEDGRPSALRLASDLERRPSSNPLAPPGGRGGWLELAYGEGGNVETMTVRAQCTDANTGAGEVCYDPQLSIDARADWLRDNCVCAAEQHYQYRWDELNRMVEARRYDRAGGAGSWALAARQRYRYDASNQRVVKQTLAAASGGGAGAEERLALYVVDGDFERRGMVRIGDAYHEASFGRQEDQYLVSGARLVWQTPDGESGDGIVEPDHRLTVALGDLLGTSGVVLDVASGELIETSTYLPSGGRESFRGGADAGAVGAEPMGFTGKESEDQVGVTYFGQRWLIARTGRWASPDPLSIHATKGGEALNAYHYVAGNLLQGRDPIGLECGADQNCVARGLEANMSTPDGGADAGTVPSEPLESSMASFRGSPDATAQVNDVFYGRFADGEWYAKRPDGGFLDVPAAGMERQEVINNFGESSHYKAPDTSWLDNPHIGLIHQTGGEIAAGEGREFVAGYYANINLKEGVLELGDVANMNRTFGAEVAAGPMTSWSITLDPPALMNGEGSTYQMAVNGELGGAEMGFSVSHDAQGRPIGMGAFSMSLESGVQSGLPLSVEIAETNGVALPAAQIDVDLFPPKVESRTCGITGCQ